MKLLYILLAVLLITTIVPVIAVADVSLDFQSVDISYHSTHTTNLTVPIFADGFSGCNLTATVENASVARIIGITYPDWTSGITGNTTLPDSWVMFKEADFNRQVEYGATNTVLITLNLEWVAEGSTIINITTVNSLDDEVGNTITPVYSYGVINTLAENVTPTPTPTPTPTITPTPTPTPTITPTPEPTPQVYNGTRMEIANNGGITLWFWIILFILAVLLLISGYFLMVSFFELLSFGLFLICSYASSYTVLNKVTVLEVNGAIMVAPNVIQVLSPNIMLICYMLSSISLFLFILTIYYNLFAKSGLDAEVNLRGLDRKLR